MQEQNYNELGNQRGGLLPGLFALLLGVTSVDAVPYRLALLLSSAIDSLTVLLIWRLIGVVAPVSMLRIGGEYTMRVFFNVYEDYRTLLKSPEYRWLSPIAMFV